MPFSPRALLAACLSADRRQSCCSRTPKYAPLARALLPSPERKILRPRLCWPRQMRGRGRLALEFHRRGTQQRALKFQRQRTAHMAAARRQTQPGNRLVARPSVRSYEPNSRIRSGLRYPLLILFLCSWAAHWRFALELQHSRTAHGGGMQLPALKFQRQRTAHMAAAHGRTQARHQLTARACVI